MTVKTLEQTSLHVCLLPVITLEVTLVWTNLIKGNETDNG
jgi:hypothetical protein